MEDFIRVKPTLMASAPRLWEQARVADKLTFVHPDFRFALPSWIHPPKQP
jgi:hypothetical protein